MISTSLCNPPEASNPLIDPAARVREHIERNPLSIRREIWYWLPGQFNGEEQMKADQGIQGKQWSPAVVAARRAGSALIPYIGVRGPGCATDAAVDDTLRPFKDSAAIALDNATEYDGRDDAESVEEARARVRRLIEGVWRLGKTVIVESNGMRFPTMVSLILSNPTRVRVSGEWWLWTGEMPNRMRWERLREAGIGVDVLVARRTNGRGAGYPNMPEPDWLKVQRDLAVQWHDRGCNAVVRTTKQNEAGIDELAAAASGVLIG